MINKINISERNTMLIITIHDIRLFNKLNTLNNQFWFTLIYESTNCDHAVDQELTVYYSHAGWESKFFFYDFFKKNDELRFRIE